VLDFCKVFLISGVRDLLCVITRLCWVLYSDWSITTFWGLLFLNSGPLLWIIDCRYGRHTSDHRLWRSWNPIKFNK
jgi:hypothetical protein